MWILNGAFVSLAFKSFQASPRRSAVGVPKDQGKELEKTPLKASPDLDWVVITDGPHRTNATAVRKPNSN